MNKKLLLVASAMVLVNSAPVYAQNEERIAELESQIEEKSNELEELKAELKELKPASESEILETKEGTFEFSNLRKEGDNYLIDLNYINKSQEGKTLWTELPFSILFEQEDGSNLNKVEPDYNTKVTANGDRQIVTMSTKIKAGGEAELTLVLKSLDESAPLLISTNALSSEKPTSIKLELQ